MSSLLNWIKGHKKECAIIGFLSGAMIVGVFIFFIFSNNIEDKIVLRHKPEGEQSEEQSSGSSGIVSDQPSTNNPSSRQADNKPVQNNNKNNHSIPGDIPSLLENHQSYEEWKAKRTPHNNNPQPSPKSSGATDQITNKPAECIVSDEHIDFSAALEVLKKKGDSVIPIHPTFEDKHVGTNRKITPLSGLRAFITKTLPSVNPLFKTSESTPFQKAHKKVVDFLIDVMVEANYESAKDQKIKELLNTARAESQSLPGTDIFKQVYDETSFSSFVTKITNFNDILIYASSQLLKKGRSDEYYTTLEMAFYIFRLFFLLTQSHSNIDYRSDFNSQIDKFESKLFATSNFEKAFDDLLTNEFFRPEEDTPAIQALISNWRTVKKDVASDTSQTILSEQPVKLSTIADVNMARKYIQQSTASILIWDYFHMGIRADDTWGSEYAKMRKSPETAALKQFGSVSDLLAFYRPGNILKPQEAVLSSQPHKGTLSFGSSTFQALTNFLPLFQASGLCDNPSIGLFAKNFLKVMTKLSKEPASTPGFTSADVYPHPGTVCMKFLRDFPSDGFSLTRVCGLIESDVATCYYPPYLGSVFSDFSKPLGSIQMIGQLFIYYASSENNQAAKMEEIPLSINLQVVGLEERKRYDLYSVIFGYNRNHGVAFVRRADNKWYNTNDYNEPSEVSVDAVPLKKSQQSVNCFPAVAFYLRTEQ